MNIKFIIKKCLYIFDNKFKSEFIYTSFLAIILSLLETIGIGIFIPLFLSFINPSHEIIESFKNINPWVKENYTTVIISLIFLIFLIKFICSLYINFQSNKYIFRLYEYITKKFFNFYINQDYNFFYKKNSSEITRNVYSEMGVLVNQIIFNIVSITRDFILVLFVVIFLLVYDLQITLIILASFIFLSFVYLKIFKKYLFEIGKNIKDQTFHVLNDLSEIFLSIKEIKIFGLENFSSNKFNENFMKLSTNKRQSLTFSFLPRLIYELFSIIVMLGVIIFLMSMSVEGNFIIFKLGIFSIAIVRIVPAVVGISTKLQSLNLFMPSLNNIYDELKNMENFKVEKEESSSVLKKIDLINTIELKDVSFSYKKDKIVLENINFLLQKGELIGLAGESGTGKTTLADIICGLIYPSSGKVQINQKYDSLLVHQSLKKNIGYVTQSNFFFDDTIKANIIFGTNYDKNKEEKILQTVINDAQIADIIKELPNGLNTRIGQGGVSLSGGQRQRVSIARSLYRCPSILILDEATNALDEKNENEILRVIKNLKKEMIIILISHRRDLLSKCDKVYRIKNKNLYEE